jgi:sugar phosphate isomerase/epimerase
MIYISSSCVKTAKIKEAVEKLSTAGFMNIELSGGTRPYPELKKDLLDLKDSGINFLCHNYFPPPNENFVLNLASLNEDIFQRSMAHVKAALELSAEIGADKFAVHAGFLIDIPLNEVGESISSKMLFDDKLAKARFVNALNTLQTIARSLNIQLYIENNVLSDLNYSNFGKVNPFFVCNMEQAIEIRQLVPGIEILCDVAHLKVSCKTLGLDFREQLDYFLKITDYIHLSDNDGFSDSNREITEESELMGLLKEMDLRNKIITFEVYTGLDKVMESYDNINKLLNA